jgi:hypothetical protein
MSTEALSLPRTASRLPLVLLALLGLIPLAVFLANPSQPLLEHHSFRQTQTAITAYWLMHGGDFFRYLTPLFGTPWTIPMEFPLYQELVALICRLTGLPIDFTGRLLSLVFFYGACAPIILCLRKYGSPAVVIAVALFLTAPINLFFSRTFLIETFATMLALSALCTYILYLRTGRVGYLWAFVLIGTVAGLQKITTFLPVAGVVGLDSVRTQLVPIFCLRWREVQWRAPVCIALSMVLPVIWTVYSDHVKQESVLSEFLTSSALREWNFGTLAQRLQWDSWYRIFGFRMVLLGGLVLAIPLVAYAASKKQLSFDREAGLFLCAGLLGPLVFFNLHFVHDYYQIGALAFLACALAISVSRCLQVAWDTSRVNFVALLLAVVAANLGTFYRYYMPSLFWVPSGDAIAYQIAREVKAHVPEDEVMVVFGQTWSSVVPYYAERYSIMVPNTTPDGLRASVVSNASAYAGDRKIGAIVYCEDGSRSAEDADAERSRLFSQVEGVVGQIEYCQIKIRG